MIKNLISLFFVFFLISCGSIDFVLKDKSKTFKNKTSISIVGDKKEKLAQELFSFFGNNDNGDYILLINFSEKKENRLVKKNQVAEKINYELLISYEVFYKNQNCNIYNKKIKTNFSFVPKSFGYNFGTDRSLERLYKNNIRDNIEEFLNLVPEHTNCLE